MFSLKAQTIAEEITQQVYDSGEELKQEITQYMNTHVENARQNIEKWPLNQSNKLQLKMP